MSSPDQVRATVCDLRSTDGKAELVGGKIIRQDPDGHRPNKVAGRIWLSIDSHAIRRRTGEAYAGTIAFVVPELSSGRESFSPDASYYNGPFPANEMAFIEGPPTFAAEVRSENDYGPAAEAEMAAKRADYFEAGTRVVWDVDPVNNVVHVYRHAAPDRPTTFRRGDTADAEPAVPGWRMNLDDLFA